MDRVSATETVDSDLNPINVRPKTTKIVLYCFPAGQSASKRDRVKPSPFVVDRLAGGSLTRRLQPPFAISWRSQFGELIVITITYLVIHIGPLRTKSRGIGKKIRLVTSHFESIVHYFGKGSVCKDLEKILLLKHKKNVT